MTFDDITQGLSTDEIRSLKEMSKGKEWQFLKRVIEHHLLRMTYDLLSQPDAQAKLPKYQGFFEGFQEIKRVIETKDD